MQKSLRIVLFVSAACFSASLLPADECDNALAACVAGAETEYTACVETPRPPVQCENEYQNTRDECDEDWNTCEDGACTPCSGPIWTSFLNHCTQPDIVDHCGCCIRDLTPLVIDLGANGIHFSSASNGVLYALGGLGPREWVGWPESADDAWLVWDRDGNGMIGDGREMFGSGTITLNGEAVRQGFAALKELDSNEDGWFDAKDPAYKSVRLWADDNRNGLSEPWELFTLRQAGVVAISLDYKASSQRDQWGNRFAYRSNVRLANGRRTLIYDVIPVTAPRKSVIGQLRRSGSCPAAPASTSPAQTP